VLQSSAIVVAFQRIEQTLATLERIQSCNPPPDEIIVHVDANQTKCEAAISAVFPDVQVLHSETCIGPGGGRNKLLAAVKHELVASFDDDSYPIDEDYFERIRILSEQFSDAAVFAAAIYEPDKEIKGDVPKEKWTSDFSGCGCVYRRSDFLKTNGFVSLPLAYGMEEVDLALRLHAMGRRILRSEWLRVYHDTDLRRHANPDVTAASIANLALLAYLRYPVSLWWIGLAQVVNRVRWLLRHGRWRGILSGLTMIPAHIFRYRGFRKRLSGESVRSFLALRQASKRSPTHVNTAL
jgi:GT2 family glycosyltransferase